MSSVTTKDQIINNVITFEQYLNSKTEDEVTFARKLLKESRNAVLYKIDGENRFAPSKFMAFQTNSMKEYKKTEEKEEKDASHIVEKVLRISAFSNTTTETKFQEYMKSLKIKPDAHERKYWRIKAGEGKNLDLKMAEVMKG